MRMLRAVVYISFYLLASNAYAMCINHRLTTEAHPGGTAIPLGSATFVCDQQPPNPEFTFDEWEWEYEGQIVKNATSFTISATSTGIKNVKFRFTVCNSTGCSGGGGGLFAIMANKPTLSLSAAGECVLSPTILHPGNRNAFFTFARSTNDTNPDVNIGAPAWQIISGAGSFSTFGLTDGAYNTKTKGTSVGRATVTASIGGFDDSGGFRSAFVVSDPAEITVTCPNIAPVVTNASGSNSPTVGGTYGYTVFWSDADGDPASEYKYVVTEKPPGSQVPEIVTIIPSPQATLPFSPDVAGEYRLSFTVKDNEALESAPFEKIVTVSPGALPEPKFKVLLAGEEYLSNDCAPNNDQCKDELATFTAGEFLVNDIVTLDGSDSTGASNLTYKWTVKKLPNGAEAPLTGKITTYPIPSEGDFEIKLVVNNGIDSLPLIKKLKAKRTIEVSYPSPGPFYQKAFIGGQENKNNLKQAWGSASGYGTPDRKPYSKFGCALATVANLLNRDLNYADVKSVDQLLRDERVYNKNNDLVWTEVPRARNSVVSQGGGFWHYVPMGNDREVAEAFARKRKYGAFVVEGLRSAVHFLAVSGFGYDTNNKRTFLIVDPADENRTALTADPFNDEFQAIRGYEVLAAPPAPKTKPRGYVSTSNPEIIFSNISINGKNIAIPRVNKLSKAFALGTVSLEAIEDDEDENSTETQGGYLLTMPEIDPGSYSVSITSAIAITGLVDVQIFNANDQLNFTKAVFVNLSPGQIIDIDFNVSNQDAHIGVLTAEKFYVRKNIASGQKISVIKGQLNLAQGGNGLNFAGEELSLSIGAHGYSLPSDSIRYIGGAFRYRNATSVSGIKSFTYYDDGQFELEVASLDLLTLFGQANIHMELQIGDDQILGFIKKSAAVSPGFLALELSKAVYSVGERAEGLVTANYKPASQEHELYLSLNIDGERNLSISETDQTWTFKSSKMAAGVHSVLAALYLQNSRLAKQTAEATKVFKQRIFEIDARLDIETDPEIILELQNEKQGLLRKIEQLEYNLVQTRTPVGAPLNAEIFVE